MSQLCEASRRVRTTSCDIPSVVKKPAQQTLAEARKALSEQQTNKAAQAKIAVLTKSTTALSSILESEVAAAH